LLVWEVRAASSTFIALTRDPRGGGSSVMRIF
jgi:hypothetical protein